MILEQIQAVADFLDRAAWLCADVQGHPHLNTYTEQPILNALTDAARERNEMDHGHHIRVLSMTMAAQGYVRKVTGWVNIPENSRAMGRQKASDILREAADLARQEEQAAA